MNETNYASILIKRIIATIIYILFGSSYTISIMKIILNTKFDLQRLLLFLVVIFFVFILIIKSIKGIIAVIKLIKETKKINIYIRNIGLLSMGLSFISLISGLVFDLIKNNNNSIFYIFIFGLVIGVVLITIDKILVIFNANPALLEIDKSDE